MNQLLMRRLRTIKNKTPVFVWFVLLAVCIIAYGVYEGNIPCRVPAYWAISAHHNNHHYHVLDRTREAECPHPPSRVQYIAYSVGNESELKYARQLELLKCAASRQRVPFLVLNPYEYADCNHLQDVFFVRHCVTAHFLKCADYTFSLDLDVIPQHDIVWENYLTKYDLVFSQALEGNEIAAGTFLVKNTDYSRRFLMEWSEYEHWQKCWWANGDQTSLHQLLMDKVNVGAYEKAECLTLMDRQKWKYQVIQWIRCTVWWIRIGSQWSSHIYITDMSEALAVSLWDSGAQESFVGNRPRTGISLPLSKHPFLHYMKPAILDGFMDWSRWTNCSGMGENWTLPWYEATTVPLFLSPYPRGFH